MLTVEASMCEDISTATFLFIFWEMTFSSSHRFKLSLQKKFYFFKQHLPSLALLTLSLAVFAPQTEPFVDDNALWPPHNSSTRCQESLPDRFQTLLRYFVDLDTWFPGCYCADCSEADCPLQWLSTTF